MTDDDTPPGAQYDYTDQNLLEEPETYEYSTLGGRPFLDAYFEDRNRTLRTLAESVERVREDTQTGWESLTDELQWAGKEAKTIQLPRFDEIGSDDPSSDRTVEPVPIPEQTQQVVTMQILPILAGYQCDVIPDDDATAWLDRFIKRYEITKRLHTQYDSNHRPMTERTTSYEAYPLLALVALVHHHRTGNLKYLNGALKLCDVISSHRPGSIAPSTAGLATVAVQEEYGTIRSLAEEFGVSI